MSGGNTHQHPPKVVSSQTKQSTVIGKDSAHGAIQEKHTNKKHTKPTEGLRKARYGLHVVTFMARGTVDQRLPG